VGSYEIREYDQGWPDAFRDAASLLRMTLGESVDRIDHIGSTSVPGLASKDVIDIQVSVQRDNDLDSVARALEEAGWARSSVSSEASAVRFFNDIGFEVTALKGLRCPTAIAIAQVTQDELRNALIEVNKDADALVQVGTNLSMVGLADEAERWLGKPVIAINAATYCMALLDNGIEDKVYGLGRLLREF
jgi:hypothetical protein